MTTATQQISGGASGTSNATRWLQLVVGVVCMIATANIQYAWTLFVPEIQGTFGWARAEIQIAFTIFVLVQTWLAPIEGYFIDKLGPRLMVAFGAISVSYTHLTLPTKRIV